ncbi:MAG: UDP-N-acetylmuramoyl-L-alanine--D-glutamate ligase [Clostridia bacterium]|nr:UDP-N-acetylmuramoyl-L-alanine--D-glutamate ligase [Clostridia bacterium]
MNTSSRLFQDVKNSVCHVLGFGKSNRPLVEFLIKHGACVKVHDKNTEILNEDIAREYASQGVEFILGESYLSGIDGGVIFRSPGFRPDLPEIATAVRNGAILTSEMELFFELTDAKIFGITGSDGKTTTTTLTYMFLDAECKKRGRGRAYVGGNIGVPLLPLAEQMTKDDFAVVELSSFQLMTMRRSPSRAIITNISPNHLDWHKGGYDEYISSKLNICMHKPASMLVTNAECEVTAEIARNSDLPITYFSSKKSSYDAIVPPYKRGCKAIYEKGGAVVLESEYGGREKILSVSEIKLPGRHNLENYMAAIAITDGYVSRELIPPIAREFGGVEHRLELVRELDGVRYYNSSIDSSPSRTHAALSALGCKPVIICGGKDKGIPFDGLARDLCSSVKAVVLTGMTATTIKGEIEKCPEYDPEKLPVTLVPDFADAVRTARDIATAGDVVLLSPACTSFDAFKNFEERGNYFKKIVNEFE